MNLASKWVVFRSKVIPESAGPQQVLFGQACFLGGAQSALSILANASGASQEDAVRIWESLQQEIIGAVASVSGAKPEDPPPPQKPLIII